MEDSGDGVDNGDDLEDTHAAAAFSAQVMSMAKTPGEESSANCGGGGGAGLGDDVLAQAMVAGEHTLVAGHVEAGRGDQGAEAGEELVGVHVGVGGAAAPRSLEGDAEGGEGHRRRRGRARGAGRRARAAGRRPARGRGRRAGVAEGAAIRAQRLERRQGQRARHGRRRYDDAGGVLGRLADDAIGQVRVAPWLATMMCGKSTGAD